MSEYLIESRDVSFQYQGSEKKALTNISFSVRQGECILLCGKSGCGKTTLTRLLNGLIPSFFPGELFGCCTAAGRTAGESAIEEYVPVTGSVFQNPKTQYFNVDTTAELAFPCENSGMEPEEIRRRIRISPMRRMMGRTLILVSIILPAPLPRHTA
ncbi:MAG: ABC transporter ATP-binding protein [Eubacteriales bacterium]|nr:ABC transporter ATP-binding protein [Eubacteriales bacterium]